MAKVKIVMAIFDHDRVLAMRTLPPQCSPEDMKNLVKNMINQIRKRNLEFTKVKPAQVQQACYWPVYEMDETGHRQWPLHVGEAHDWIY